MKLNAMPANLVWKCLFLIAVLSSSATINLRSVKSQEKIQKPNEQCDECCEKCRNEYLLTCPSAPVLLEKFDYLSTHEWEMAQIDKLLTRMQNNINADGIIVVYAGRVNKYGEFEIRTKRIKDYIKYRNFEINRIKIVHGGFREKFEFELWLAPLEGSFPPLTPTIAPEKVKFRGVMKPSNEL